MTTFPHRLSSGFQYLCSSSEAALGYFTLKDLTERGKFVFGYLSIAASQDTSFAVMDIFRQLDRSGTGKVHAEDFVVGIVRHLLTLSSSSKRVDDLALEMWQQLAPTGVTASILSALEDTKDESSIPQKLQRCPLFCANLLAIKYRIEANLMQNNRGLTKMALSNIITASLEEVVAEILLHFHISTTRLGELLAEDAMYGSLGGVGLGADQHVQERLKAVSAAKQRLQSLPVVWYPLNRGTGGMNSAPPPTAMSAALNFPADMTPSMKRQSMLALGLASSGQPIKGLLAHDGDEDDDDERNGGSGGAMSSRQKRQSVSFRQSISGGIGAQGSVRGPGETTTRRETLGSFIDYLAQMGVPTDGDAAEAALDQLDSTQMFLLQTAYKSLDSFFALMSQDAETGLMHSASSTISSASAASLSIPCGARPNDVKYRLAGLKTLVCGDVEDTSMSVDDLVSPAGPYGPSYLNRQRTRALADSVLPFASENPASLQKAVDEKLIKGHHLTNIEGELAQALCESQDELRRTRMRLEIVGLVQAHVASQVQSAAALSPLDAALPMHSEDSRGRDDEQLPEQSGSLTRSQSESPCSWKRNDSTAGRLFEQIEGTKDEAAWGRTPSSETKGSSRDPMDCHRGHITATPLSASISSGPYFVKSTDPPPSFDDILGELSGVRALLASRGQSSTALGHLLATPSAIVPLHGDKTIGPTLKNLEELADKLSETLQRVQVSEESQTEFARALREAEENEAQLVSFIQTNEGDKTKHMSTEIELQMSREELKRLQVENINAKVWSRALDHCQIQLKEKDNDLKKRGREIAELRQKLEGGDNQVQQLEENFKLKTQLESLNHDKDRVDKENRRLEKGFKNANEKLSGKLHEVHKLQKLLHASEDELEESKAQIQRLFRTIVDMKTQTAQMEELRRRLELLKGQVEEKDKELSSTRGVVELANALKRETTLNDEHIFKLEDDLSELRIQVDLAEPLRKNFEDERNKLRQASKEINELKTAKHELLFQLHDLKQVEERNAQLTLDLQEFKAKVDKLPGLVGDVAKLRASSRASVHALKEQDKLFEQVKRERGRLEKENERLKLDLDRCKNCEILLKEKEEELVTIYIPVRLFITHAFLPSLSHSFLINTLLSNSVRCTHMIYS